MKVRLEDSIACFDEILTSALDSPPAPPSLLPWELKPPPSNKLFKDCCANLKFQYAENLLDNF